MRVLIACGGTAGHVFPGLALAEELKSQQDACKVVIVVSAQPRDKKFLSKSASHVLGQLDLEVLSATALPYSFSFKYILFVFRLIWAFLKSCIIILRHSPNVAVGMGGYASFAPLFAARLMGIPTLIHEQNLIPGRANRFLGRIVDKIAISFDETKSYFMQSGRRKKIVKTGLPLRRQIRQQSKSLADGKRQAFTILVAGGSQGASSINKLFLDCLSYQIDKATRQHLHVIHLTGEGDFGRVQARYANLDVSHQVFDFLTDMVCAYKIADLLIGRSGASTIFEAANFGVPCIFIPYCYGTLHQKENALYLKNNDCAIVLDEQKASAEDLGEVVLELMRNDRWRKELAGNISRLNTPEASRNLKEEIFALHLRD